MTFVGSRSLLSIGRVSTDVLVIATDTNWTVKLNANGAGDFKSPTTDLWIGTNNIFLRTNTFDDYREKKTVNALDLDVGKFNQWMAGNPLKSIYVEDRRSSSTNLTAVRVTNGQILTNGLTIATARPLYVRGDFNTLQTKPASLVGDSITILSTMWNDAYTSRMPTAGNTTVNAALLAGIVPTTNVGGIKHYSGGVHNFPRFLENWNGQVFTFNGSMVALFPSRYATNFWKSPGDYYYPPTRQWAFDVNFLNKDKLPPLTPEVQKLVRGQWRVIAATSPN